MRAGRPFAMLALLLAGCTATAQPSQDAPPALAGYFDCLRLGGQALVGVHRGGPAPGLPENALTTLAATLDRNPRALLEVDVQRSADGRLFLLHDATLDRTTTGYGPAAALPWRALSRLRLKDDDGRVTAARLPTLAAALALAVRRDAILQLDIKRGTPVEEVAAEVRAGGAQAHVILITYGADGEATAARAAPDLMRSVEMFDGEDPPAAGDPRALLGFTGTRAPSPRHLARLRALGVEPIVATLGRAGERLDDRWLADGDPSEYAAAVRDGAVVIATDRAAEVEPALPPLRCVPPR